MTTYTATREISLEETAKKEVSPIVTANLDGLAKFLSFETMLSTLDQIPMKDVKADDTTSEADVQCCIAETMAHRMLSKCPDVRFETDLDKRVNGYEIEPHYFGARVYIMKGDKRVRTKVEYDMLVFYKDMPVVVQVKSMKQWGLYQKIGNSLKTAQQLYGTKEVGMLAFFPFYTNWQKYPQMVEKNNPEVRCIDLGYNKKQLQEAMNRFYKARSSRVDILGC